MSSMCVFCPLVTAAHIPHKPQQPQPVLAIASYCMYGSDDISHTHGFSLSLNNSNEMSAMA